MLRIRRLIGEDRFNGYGFLTDWRFGLVPGVEAGLLGGATASWRNRLARPESVAALTLNTFLPWLATPEGLRLGGIAGYRELHFDARCPTGVRGTPPHIDLVASGPDGSAGVSVQAFGYLSGRQGRLSPAYASLQVPPSLASWLKLLRQGADGEGRFRYVDVPSLAKLALGLGRIFLGRQVRLVYLFLEPTDVPRAGPFALHRAELAQLVTRTADSTVRLDVRSFHELWEEWLGSAIPPVLREIVAELIHRYAVATPR